MVSLPDWVWNSSIPTEGASSFAMIAMVSTALRHLGQPQAPFLHSWDVQAFSTNYLRTVLSAQCFLDGLLGTGCFVPTRADDIELEDDESRLVPDHMTVGDATSGTVSIRIRDRSTDNLNAFDRNPNSSRTW
jgi:hypothetical protein